MKYLKFTNVVTVQMDMREVLDGQNKKVAGKI
jgi:hypothetical protein